MNCPVYRKVVSSLGGKVEIDQLLSRFGGGERLYLCYFCSLNVLIAYFGAPNNPVVSSGAGGICCGRNPGG